MGRGARCLAIGLFLFGALNAFARQDNPKYVPASTSVAILPVINMSGLTGKQGDDIVKVVTAELHHQLADRGFRVVEGKPIDDAILSGGVDLSDSEQQLKNTIYGIGRKAGTDLVVFVTIVDVKAETVGGFGISESEGDGKIKCWLLDVKANRALISGHVEASHNRRNVLGAYGGQVARMGGACVTAIGDVLKQALAPYPLKETERTSG